MRVQIHTPVGVVVDSNELPDAEGEAMLERLQRGMDGLTHLTFSTPDGMVLSAPRSVIKLLP